MQNRRTWRVVRPLLFVAAGLLPPALLFAVVFCNPMLLAFLATFTIENRSGTDVWVTPIGLYEGSGRYGPLPTYRNDYAPAIPMRGYDLALRAGGSRRVIYD